MHHAIVVDASVAVKWVIDEPFTDQALKLWEDCANDRRPVFSAPHFPGEVVNAVFQRVRTADAAKHIDFADAETFVRTFLDYPVQLAHPPSLYQEAFDS